MINRWSRASLTQVDSTNDEVVVSSGSDVTVPRSAILLDSGDTHIVTPDIILVTCVIVSCRLLLQRWLTSQVNLHPSPSGHVTRLGSCIRHGLYLVQALPTTSTIVVYRELVKTAKLMLLHAQSSKWAMSLNLIYVLFWPLSNPMDGLVACQRRSDRRIDNHLSPSVIEGDWWFLSIFMAEVTNY